jgi:hypothetical protein
MGFDEGGQENLGVEVGEGQSITAEEILDGLRDAYTEQEERLEKRVGRWGAAKSILRAAAVPGALLAISKCTGANVVEPAGISESAQTAIVMSSLIAALGSDRASSMQTITRNRLRDLRIKFGHLS